MPLPSAWSVVAVCEINVILSVDSTVVCRGKSLCSVVSAIVAVSAGTALHTVS